MNTKKLLAIGSALLLVAGFVSIGAGPANAENADNTNNTSYWENVYPGSTCYKDDAKYGAVSSDGMTVTLSGSYDWTALIVKGGAVDYGQGPGNKVYGSPVSGTPYSPPLNAGNQQAAVSHWIVCVGNPPPLIKVTPVKPEVTSHDVCGVANDSLTVDSSMTGVVYTVSWNGDHSVATVTATVSDSSKYVFAEGATTSWTYDFTNEACPPTVVTPVKPEVTSHDVCGVANDSLTVDSSMTGVVYTVSW
ncbi:MAG: hypothetical protein ABI238_06265, partial [Terrimesophilobacter sp.]